MPRAAGTATKPVTINTDADVRRVTRPGFYRVAVSLYLKVTRRGPSVRRQWVQRIMVDGRQVDRGLGGADLVSIDEAKLTAMQNRRAARQRVELPHGVRTAARTFLSAANGCRRANEGAWKAASLSKWNSIVGKHLAPLHEAPLADVDRGRVVALLSPMTPATARHCRRVIRMAFDYAMSKGWCDSNPCTGIDAALPMLRRNDAEHHAAADCGAAPRIYRRLAAAAGDDAASACLAVAMLTGARSNEARGMVWSEIERDGDEAIWRVPADRMKAGREHVIPLTPAAAALIESQPRRERTDLVFVGAAGRKLDGNTISRRLQDGEGVPHGFRSCLRTWLTDNTDHDEATIEGCLAHVHGSQTARAYVRTDRRAKRRAALEAWTRHLESGE